MEVDVSEGCCVREMTLTSGARSSSLGNVYIWMRYVSESVEKTQKPMAYKALISARIRHQRDTHLRHNAEITLAKDSTAMTQMSASKPPTVISRR